ncbi:MAG: Alpha-galactosidase [Candidatus Ordinivivax streblomastigis]|uniref:alpha-galactosidase n=1 Tax=Candidatus Ordinivivax streblomastigis TaxID=2540710 RepID=A0A5M8P4Y2_9BACT|nr:MAG: Alpha-galactosidase [Candidatus Ordinivivax streblomastigis]
MTKRISFWAFLCLFSGFLLQAQTKVNLSDLSLPLMTTGYGKAVANKSIDRNPIRLNGKEYQGVGTHAESKFIVSLNGKAKRFSAWVGVDDEVGTRGSVVFVVTADGKELFRSPVMHGGDKPAKVDVQLKKVDTVVLEALSGNDGISSDHADWANAFFEMEEGKPAALPDCRIIEIGAGQTLLTLTVDKKNNLLQQYFGQQAGLESVFRNGEQKEQAYPTIQSNSRFTYWGEPALHVVHADGHTSSQLKYVNHETTNTDDNVTITVIHLKDDTYPFFVDLFYQTYKKENVMEQWSEIRHQEPQAVVVKEAASSALTLHARGYWLTQFTGDWANEFQIDEYPLTVGSKVLENKWGITSSNGRQQHFMISMGNKEPSETEGEVLAGSLAWSGNYRLQFEVATSGQLTVLSGMNPWSADYTLPAGKTYRTPALIYTYSTQGKGQASRNLHRWALNYNVREGNTALLRTIFNNWEATGMNTSDPVIIPFLKPAHDLGFELFLLDDGWFGLENKARVLGEWNSTPKMHPHGMTPIIEAAKATGIDFGLWVEMEMANPEAHLVKEHPEWLLTEPDREHHLQRGQYVLDLANPDVQDFCIHAFNAILKTYPDISFVKWDCNSPFHNPYSQYLGKQQQHLWYEYTMGLYRVFNETVKANPDLQMMLCSAGGARCDYGALRYFHEFWTSDNTNPLRRVFIQWGSSHIFPAKVQGAHVTHMGKQPFKFAFDVAMSGCLGMDANPVTMSEKDRAITKRAVEVYKAKIRPVVQLGDIYRLVSPYKTSRSVVSYVSEARDKAVVFVYQVKNETQGVTIALQGLQPGKQYKVEEVNIDAPASAACAENGKTLSSKTLMEEGLHFNCSKQFDSASVYLSIVN